MRKPNLDIPELRELMSAKGIPNYRQLALTTNLSPSALHMFINHKTKHSPKTTPRIASFLEITPKRLYEILGKDPATLNGITLRSAEVPSFYSRIYGEMMIELTRIYHAKEIVDRTAMIGDISTLIEKYTQQTDVKGSAVVKDLLEAILKYNR
ncbi:MAG TPA: hypothetical protein VJI32_08045 [Candidatus Nanoarchaeia archaeon]|nr:hypothetical protein [Candidatus Nanoarchaeia archaeon]